MAAGLAAAEAESKSFGTREEHRLSMELLVEMGRRMEARDLFDRPLVCPLQHPPFLAIPSLTILQYLKANVTKFAFGFEYSLTKDGGKIISPAAGQMALMFLQFLKASYGGFPLPRNSGMWIDVGRQEEGRAPRHGMGLKRTLSQYGYGFFQRDKIAWEAWGFKSDVKDQMLFSISRFAKSYSKAYQRVAQAADFDTTCHELCTWLAAELTRDDMTKNSYRALQIIWKWMCENFVWEFQKEILQACHDILPEDIPEAGWKPNNIKFDAYDLDCYMHYDLELVNPNPNGKSSVKTPLDRLEHLWGWDTGNPEMARHSWEKKPYRLRYRTGVRIWNERIGCHGWEWSNEEFFKYLIRRCYIWPNTTTGKWFPSKNVPAREKKQGRPSKRHVWHALSSNGLKSMDPKNWRTETKGNNLPYNPIPLSPLWLNKGTAAIQEYIAKCNSGDKWQDLGLVYRWRWGTSLRLPNCSIQQNTPSNSTALCEPKWVPLTME